jgi:RHH-type rel operon transcriptional repressor/antitoxin RelB
MGTTTVTIRIPAEMHKRLEKLAGATERSKSWLAARAISAYLESEEWQVARIRKGIRAARAGRVVPGEQVDAWLASWGSRRKLLPPRCK